MAGLTATGLQTLRYSEVVDNVSQYLFKNLSQKLNISENSDLGILLAAVCTEISDLWEAVSAVNDSSRIDKAEDFSLDDLVGLNGVYRYVAMPTTGYAEFTGDVGTDVTTTTILRTTAGAIYYPRTNFTISPTSCVETNVLVNSVKSGETYTIILDNVIYKYTATDGDNELSILNNLAKAVNNGLVAVAEVNSSSKTMKIARDEGDITKRTQPMVVTVTTYLSFGKTVALQSVESEETGSITGFANTLLYIDSPVSGLDSVYNRYDFTVGRGRETDEELRERYYTSLSVVGVGTLDSISAAVGRVSNVTAVQSVENSTETFSDELQLPAKTFRITAVGGSNSDIAQAIWDTKPAAIRSYGTVPGTAYDKNNKAHVIYFDRPTPKYAFVKISYYIDSEESLSIQQSAVPDAIKSAVISYGSSLTIGDDIIPNRALRYIYESVQGVVVESIKVAVASNQQTVPNDSDYTSSRIKIGPDEFSVWESNQFEVNQQGEPS